MVYLTLQNWNNNIYFIKSITDKDGYIQITIPLGAYEIESLNREIKRINIEKEHYTEAKHPFTKKQNFPEKQNITFHYNRFSNLPKDSLKSMGRFRIELLLEDNTWSTQYTIPKNSQYSNTSTEWTLLNLNFTAQKYGIKSIFDEIDRPHADMCFSNITMTHSVF